MRVLQSRGAGVAAPREPRHACALRGIGTKPPGSCTRAPGPGRIRAGFRGIPSDAKVAAFSFFHMLTG
ncbi:conserved hypothetical protein [Burkholderia pseudomallei 668]|nr:conserved hypothetical protein [Burkholderia pseudomallei 668]